MWFNLQIRMPILRQGLLPALFLLLLTVLPGSAIKAQTTPQHEFSISLSAAKAAESNSGSNIVATATLSVSNPTSLNFTVEIVLCVTGTATEGTDYTLIASSTTDRITFRSDPVPNCNGGHLRLSFNSSISSWQFRIQVNGEEAIENDETIIISIVSLGTLPENASKVGISSTAGSATFTIEDDDSPTANFAATSSSADEDDGTVTVAVNLSKNAIMNTDVAYSVSSTAASDTDFAALLNTVQITSGSKTANISIPITDDAADEPNETIVLTLSDGFGYKIGTPNVYTLTINNDDATPRITSDAIVDVPEGTTRVLTITATDTDDDDDELTYSITAGVDSAQFRIDQSDGDLAFKTAPDFEAPRSDDDDNVYEVIVTASDGTNTDMQTINVTVTDENDNDPMITSNNTKSVAEGTADLLTVTATDADAGTVIIYSISGGADGASFSINSTSGALTFTTAPDFENPSDQGRDNEYVVEVMASDGTNSAMQTITVTVTDVNEAPTIVAQTFSVTENATTGTTIGTVAATDEDTGNNLTFSITAGNTGNAFDINENTGGITVAGTIDHETTPTYTLTVQVSDGSLSATSAVTINVTNVNEPPVITSPTTASVAENTTTVLIVTATDADAGTTLTYSISGGADRALFRINRTSGALTLQAAPDFENPTDQGSDNEYIVEVMASDGTKSAMQTITITVTNDPSDDVLGFSEAEKATVIFPNPSGDYLEVRSSVGDTFQILSLSGKPLLEGTTNTRIDITFLRSGLYLVQLPDGRLLKFVRE